MNNLIKVGFLQALGIVSYITLVASFMQNGEKFFAPLGEFVAGIMFLTLFATSILVCAFITLGYPIRLFWIKKKPAEAIRIVMYMTGFLLLFFLVIVGTMLLS